MAEEKEEVLETQSADGAEIRDTDIVFDCPHCSKTLVIDYRGAGLQISCSECGKDVLVPIPDGMELTDLDMDPGEILKQLFATRRNYQKAETRVQGLKARLVSLHSSIQGWYPGDVLSTGTPRAFPIADGDTAECRILGPDGFAMTPLKNHVTDLKKHL